jgi:hypothetical protein
MMKKLFMVAAMLSAVCSINAQTLEVSPASKAAQPIVNNAFAQPAKIDAGANQVWWGYAKGTENRSAVGFHKAESCDQAIFIPGTTPFAVGNTIKAVRFYLRSTSNISAVKIWISKTLPKDVSKADYVQTVDLSTLTGGDESSDKMGKANDVALTTPYTITEKGAYVGYTYTLTDESDQNFTVTTKGTNDIVKGLYVRTSSSERNWMDAFGMGYGNLAFQVLLDGTIGDNAAMPEDLGDIVIPLNGSTDYNVPLTNIGKNDISSFDYTLMVDSVAGREQHEELDVPIKALGGKSFVDIPFDDATEVGTKSIILTITKVNRADNQATTNSAKGVLAVVTKAAQRNVVVEEKTGNGNGWCVRGFVGMKNLKDKFGDKFIGISAHQNNNSDPMYFRDYPNVGFTDAPCCVIDRNGKSIDPLFGVTGDICKDVANEYTKLPLATIKVNGTWNADSTAIDVTSTSEILTNTTDSFGIAYALVVDSLIGNVSGWKQYNNYSKFTSDELPASLEMYSSEGTFGTGSLDCTYDNVLLSSSYKGSLNNATGFKSLALNTPATNTFSIPAPTSTKVTDAFAVARQNKKVSVVAMILRANGQIVNAAEYRLGTTVVDGINDISDNNVNVKEVARYNAAGQLINGAQKGINIIKLSNGKTLKVMVNK